jgi:hypothetical protein
MPSIEDVANQINAKLDAINNNTSATAVNTSDTLAVVTEIRDLSAQANSLLSAVRDELSNGFSNLSHGLFAVIELQRATIHVLDHHRQQNDTIICELVNGNELLCGITRKLTDQLEMSDSTLTAVRRLEGMAERELAGPAGDYDRALELQQRIEECCPPPRQEPEPCPSECDRPDYEQRKPSGQDWEPLPPRRDAIG